MDEIEAPPEAVAPIDSAEPEPPPPPKRGRGRGWRIAVVLATLAIVALVAFAGLALSVRANPRRYVDALMGGSQPTSLSAAGNYMAEMSFGGLSTKFENTFSADYQKPNRLRLEHGVKGKQHLLVVSDGKDLHVDAGDGDSVAKAPAPADLAKLADDPEIKKQMAEMAKATGIDPTKPADLGKQITGCYVGVSRQSEWMHSLKRPGLSLPITIELKNGLSVTVWLNPRTRAPRQVAYDVSGEQMAKAVAQSPGGKGTAELGADLAKSMAGARIKVLLTFTSWRENHPPAATRFAYRPPQNAKVNTAKTWRDLPAALMGLPEGGPALEAPEGKTLVGQTPPDFAAVSTDGQVVKLSSLRGQPVVLDFWATWCPPCRESMPLLDEMYKEYREQGLRVVAISSDTDLDTVKAFLAKQPVSFRVLWLDPSSDAARTVDKAYGITAIPRTLYIDKDGVVRADTTGLHSAEDMRESLAKIGLRTAKTQSL